MRQFLKLNFTDYEENYDQARIAEVMTTNVIQQKEHTNLNVLFKKEVDEDTFYK
jgi:hypothetical protein